MENTMTVSTPNEVSVSDPIKNPVIPDVSLDPMDFQKEMAKIAAEQGMKIDNGVAVKLDELPQAVQQAASQPEKTVPPQAEAQPNVTVPEKFVKDGHVDLQKVEKSTLNAEEAIRRYQEKEAELRKLQNNVHQLEKTVQPNQQSLNIQQQSGALTPEQINKALSETQNPGKVLLELQQMTYNAALQQARADAFAEVEAVRSRVEAQQRTAELQRIADRDPWVLTNEGIESLGKIRTQKPWLNNAPEPWFEAYKDYVATKTLESSSQVQMTNPTPQTVKAPPTPVNGGTRVPQTSVSLAALTQSQGTLNKFLDGLTPEQQKQFWAASLPGSK